MIAFHGLITRFPPETLRQPIWLPFERGRFPRAASGFRRSLAASGHGLHWARFLVCWLIPCRNLIQGSVVEIGDPISNEELLPYDDPSRFPGYCERVFRTAALFLIHPLKTLDKITYYKHENDSFSFLFGFLWPATVFTELFKYAVRNNSWLHYRYGNRFDLSNITFVGMFLSIIFFPLGVWVGLWFGAFVYHSALWFWRGLHERLGITQTLRAIGFTYGLIFILSLPITMVAFLFPSLVITRNLQKVLALVGVVYLGLALSRAHCTKAWRGIASSLTPLLIVFSLFMICEHPPLGSLLR
jgi:hypothetical protein